VQCLKDAISKRSDLISFIKPAISSLFRLELSCCRCGFSEPESDQLKVPEIASEIASAEFLTCKTEITRGTWPNFDEFTQPY